MCEELEAVNERSGIMFLEKHTVDFSLVSSGVKQHCTLLPHYLILALRPSPLNVPSQPPQFLRSSDPHFNADWSPGPGSSSCV